MSKFTRIRYSTAKLCAKIMWAFSLGHSKCICQWHIEITV